MPNIFTKSAFGLFIPKSRLDYIGTGAIIFYTFFRQMYTKVYGRYLYS
ncbi:MAG: hypothetical protein RLZZ507_4043 [Cyanobacteriota bacterium]|jgi:hypothetical protein